MAKKKLWLVLGIIAGLLATFLAAGWLTNWFGFYGPCAKVLSAAKNTLNAGNFTIRCSYGGDTASTICVELDREAQKLNLAIYDEDGQITTAIYGGYWIRNRTSGDKTYTYATDISEDLADFFSTQEVDGDIRLLLRNIDDLLGGWISKHFEIDALEPCLIALYRNLNSDRWLRDNAGFTKEKQDGVTLYHFQPQLYQTLSAVLKPLEPASKNGDLADMLSENQGLLDSLDVQISFGIQQRKLVSLRLDLDFLGIMLLEFDAIGSTVVDEEALEQLLEAAKK